MSPKTKLVLDNLRANHEGSTLLDGTFAQVYLDNARPAGMSARSFAGHLAALEKLGFYKSQGDDCFGDVKLED